ncbi:MAG: hypothetical protein ACRDIB_11905 [Ardenticatenaceae bacterium]
MNHHEEERVPEVQIERVGESGERSTEAGLGEEFKEFGRQLMRAIRAVADSDELRNLGHEIVESMRDIGEDIQETFEQARSKEEVQKVGEQAKRVTQVITSREAASDLQTSLSQALHSLNDELNKIIDQVQTRTSRMSGEVESSAREAGAAGEEMAGRAGAQASEVASTAGGMQEGSEDEMGEALSEAVSESALGAEPIRESGDSLEEKWQEETQPGPDLSGNEERMNE